MIYDCASQMVKDKIIKHKRSMVMILFHFYLFGVGAEGADSVTLFKSTFKVERYFVLREQTCRRRRLTTTTTILTNL